MTEEIGNVARTREFVRLVQEQGRVERFDEFVHPEFRNHSAEPGLAGGRDGARATMTLLHRALADVRVEVVHCFEHDGVVATNKIIRGRHVGDWLGQAATGSRVALHVMDFLRFEDGRIIEHWSTARPLRPIAD
ncbi:ester cyclase [Amycolatopsis sp. PS_44_ISF1]|uniref:ester cyclase n=1 Tax=Amycolatopsis sp. PS_44_ISF1 TaxID=2974917 RepID=UPI0028DE91BE|nr:ester cyclase [Amycolatopsis sp. PS_44_ISF1]MDT8914707.1 ester cyclase [Amycolatopsis sp. PS_44_ISF1]